MYSVNQVKEEIAINEGFENWNLMPHKLQASSVDAVAIFYANEFKNKRRKEFLNSVVAGMLSNREIYTLDSDETNTREILQKAIKIALTLEELDNEV